MDKSADVQFKGLVFKSFLAALEALKGADAVKRTKENLSAELRGRIDGGEIVVGGFYPAAWYAELHAAAQTALGQGDELARAMGRETTRRDIQGVLKWIVRIVSPSMLLSNADRIWASYAKGGKVHISKDGDRAFVVRYEECGGLTTALWEELMGGTEVVLEIAGVTSPIVERTAGGRTGDRRMALRVRWSPK